MFHFILKSGHRTSFFWGGGGEKCTIPQIILSLYIGNNLREKNRLENFCVIDLSFSIAYFTYFLSSEWKPPSSFLCVSPSCLPDRPRKPRWRRTKEWLLKKGFQVGKQIISVYHFLVFKTWPKTISKCAPIETVMKSKHLVLYVSKSELPYT